MLDGVGSLILHQGKRYVLRSVARDEGIKSKYLKQLGGCHLQHLEKQQTVVKVPYEGGNY